MFKIKRYFSLIIIVFLILTVSKTAFSIPASRDLKEIKMPDGTIIKARLIGDEYMSWFESEDGYTMLKNPSGFFEYATHDKGGALVPSGIEVMPGKGAPPLKTHLRPSRAAVIAAKTREGAPSRVRRAPQAAPVITGDQEAMVILIDYPATTDVDATPYPFDGAHDNAYFVDLYFGGLPGDLDHYFDEISYGNVNFAGTISNVYTAANDKAYYGVQDINSPDFTGAQELALEAVTAADADIVFTEALHDVNTDGYVDNIVIIHAGPDAAATADPTDIWSHSWALFAEYTTNDPDALKIRNYVMNSEDTQIGVHAHELLHNLGAPDLYDLSGVGNPLDDWCIMDYGAYSTNGGNPVGSRPTQLCGYLRYDLDADKTSGIDGWLEAADFAVIDADGSYTINQLEDFGASVTPKLYRVNIPGDNEYFLIENRQPVGYDLSLPAITGIVIYHVDEAMPDNAAPYAINDSTNSFFRIAIEDPGGNPGIPVQPHHDLAAYNTDSWTIFSDDTYPDSKSNDGLYSGVSLTITNSSAVDVPMIFNYGLQLFAETFPYTGGPENYEMMAFPMVLADTDAVNNFGPIFDPLAEPGVYDPEIWRIYTYSSGNYVQPPDSMTDLVPGRGYWVVSLNDAVIDLTGSPVDAGTDFTVTLTPGWNMVGNPFTFTVDASDLLVDDGATPVSLPGGTLTLPDIYYWQSSGYVTSSQMLANRAYWVKNTTAGDITLTLPPIAAAPAPAPLMYASAGGDVALPAPPAAMEEKKDEGMCFIAMASYEDDGEATLLDKFINWVAESLE